MKHSEFQSLASKELGVSEKTLAVYIRNLKNAGLLTMGARGINAPDMTAKDMAILIIAVLATDKPAHAVEAAQEWLSAEPITLMGYGLDDILTGELEQGDLADCATFLDAVLLMIEGESRTKLLEVNRTNKSASAVVSGGTLSYSVKDAPLCSGGTFRTCGIHRDSLQRIAAAFAHDTAKGATD